MPRRKSGRKIDFTHWTGFALSESAQAAGVAAQTLLSAQHLPETLLRTRGQFSSYVDGNAAPGERARMGSGMILVPEGTGTTVLWSPLTDFDAPWFWLELFTLGYEEYVNDVVDCPGMTSFRSVIDSKAMRVVKNQELQWVTENATTGTALSANTDVIGRFLSGT